MFKAKKIRRSFCLQSFLFWLFIDSIYARYFFIIVPPFKLLVVSLMSFSVVSKKLFSHSNHVSLLVSNFFHQPVRVFCGHLGKVNFDKRLVHSSAISKPNDIFLIEVGFVSTRVKGSLPFPPSIPCHIGTASRVYLPYKKLPSLIQL